ncbi:hypothetical protein ABMA28_009471 [Loxostege sticticalis]|uniref:MADF domain-containing protein n=1 Tax=Loxostege sticticalis TaxID=481309 RepID=A0ABD0SE13_LOXSC
MNEELLIELVRQYPELFNPFDKKYHDELRRNNIWCEIGNMMKENPDTCKARWKRIRDNFRRAKTLRKSKISKGGGKLIKPVKYEEELAFLNPLLGDDEDKCPAPTGDEEEQTISPPSTPGSHEGTRQNSRGVKRKKGSGNTATPIRDLLQSCIETNKHKKTEPTIVDFFTNLGRTVNTFPEDVQISVKGEVFNIIHKAESVVLQRKIAEAQGLTNSEAYRVMMLPGVSAVPVQPVMNETSNSAQSSENYYNSENSEIQLIVKSENFDETCGADS